MILLIPNPYLETVFKKFSKNIFQSLEFKHFQEDVLILKSNYNIDSLKHTLKVNMHVLKNSAHILEFFASFLHSKSTAILPNLLHLWHQRLYDIKQLALSILNNSEYSKIHQEIFDIQAISSTAKANGSIFNGDKLKE